MKIPSQSFGLLSGYETSDEIAAIWRNVKTRHELSGLRFVNDRTENIAEATPMCSEERDEQRCFAHRDASALL